MNASNHSEEAQHKPLHLCPVCLRKLHLACEFDIMTRYQALLEFCTKNGLCKHGEWLNSRIERLNIALSDLPNQGISKSEPHPDVE